MSLASTLEGWHAVLRGLQRNLGNDIGAQFTWEGSFSSSGATFSVTSGQLHGAPLTLAYRGTLSGTLGQNLTWSGVWSGMAGLAAVSASDSGTWLFDANEDGYTAFLFDQDGEHERLSPAIQQADADKWFMRGAEVLGAIVGGVLTKSWATGSTAFGFLTLGSDWIYDAFAPPVRPPVPPPAKPGTLPPKPPAPPAQSEVAIVDPATNTVTKNVRSFDDTLELTDATEGLGTTRVTVVPEPSSFLLFGLALLLAFVWIVFRRRPIH